MIISVLLELVLIGLSGILVILAGVVVYRLTKGRLKPLRFLLFPALLAVFVGFWIRCWSPRDVTDPSELARRFEHTFQIALPASVSDMHYQVATGMDDESEWIRFRTDTETVDRLTQKLSRATKEECRIPREAAPKWWHPEQEAMTEFFSNGRGSQLKESWLAHDRSKQIVYYYGHALN